MSYSYPTTLVVLVTVTETWFSREDDGFPYDTSTSRGALSGNICTSADFGTSSSGTDFGFVSVFSVNGYCAGTPLPLRLAMAHPTVNPFVVSSLPSYVMLRLSPDRCPGPFCRRHLCNQAAS